MSQRVVEKISEVQPHANECEFHFALNNLIYKGKDFALSKPIEWSYKRPPMKATKCTSGHVASVLLLKT